MGPMETSIIQTTDPINAQILAVSEDKVQGFVEDPLGEISRLAGLPVHKPGWPAMERTGCL